MIDKLEFSGEEVVFKLKPLEKKDTNIFNQSNMVHEKKAYQRYEIIKVGKKQIEYKVGDFILVDQNGLGDPIKIENYGIIEDTYSFPTHQRIYCKINE